MKKNIYTSFVAIAALLLLQACYKDLGNYNYNPIDEVTITNISDKYEIKDGFITIQPVLTSTFLEGVVTPEHEDNYTYKWFVQRGSQVDTIAHSRSLNEHALGLAIGLYDACYRVTNKSTSVYFDKTFQISITTENTRGFLVLNEIAGEARVDMISYFDNLYHVIPEIFGDIGMPAIVNPFKIVYVQAEHTALTNYGLGTPGRKATYLLGSSLTERVGYVDGGFIYTPQCNIQYQFIPGLCPPGFVAENLQSYNNSYYLLLGQGNLYQCNPTSSMWFGSPVNTLDNTNFFTPSSKYALSLSNGWLVFDEDTKSMYRLMTNASRCNLITGSSASSYVNMEKDIVWMGANVLFGTEQRNSYYYAILKDASNDYWLLRTYANTFEIEYLQQMDATDIANATNFAVGGLYSLDVYYTVGGKVYRYNIPLNTSYLALDKSPATITYMDIGNFSMPPTPAVPSENTYDAYKFMVVASFDGTTGTVGCYNIFGDLTTWTLYQHPVTGETFQWSGFGKIVSLAYKAS